MRQSRSLGWQSIRRFGPRHTLFFAGVALLVASCDGPQAPVTTPPDELGGHYGNGRLEFKFDTASNATSALSLVAGTLAFDAPTHTLRAQVAVRNDGSESVPGPERILVYGFVPGNIEPVNATCVPADAELGVPHCSFDHAGTYGDGALAPGETSTPVEWVLHVPSGESFAFRARLGSATAAPGTISGVVFDDRDDDGRRDGGEGGLQGAIVHLHNGTETHDATSDAQGGYAFLVEAPGLYELTADAPAGTHATTPTPLQVTILQHGDGSLSSFALANFGFAGVPGPVPEVHIEGIAFDDANRNGLRDEGELGLAGVKIEGKSLGNDGGDDGDDDGGDDDDRPALVDPELPGRAALPVGPGPRIADGGNGDPSGDGEGHVRTDPQGHYALVLHGNGPWKVSGGSLDGFDRTTPKKIVFTTPPATGETLHADFGYAHEDLSSRSKIRGSVFFDRDGDGIHDVGEPGLTGVAVGVTGSCALPSDATDHTDARGRYELDGEDVHCPLPWTLRRAAIPGTIATTPAEVVLDAPPANGGREYNIEFGVAIDPAAGALPAYTIEGSVFVDANRNGTREVGESGVAAAQVLLLGPCDAVRAATTDIDGHYSFAADVVGQCAVTAVWQSLPDFGRRTTPNPVLVDPAGPAGGTGLGIDFGVRIDR